MEEVPLHPLAVKVLDRVEVAADGARSAIPAAALAKIRHKLGRHQDDRLLFVHLVVLHARLRRAGLVVAADQLLELARIGLGADVAGTLERVETSREAQKTLRAPISAHSPTSGLAAAAPLGVRLRPGPDKGR